MPSVTRSVARHKGRSSELEQRVLSSVLRLLADGTRYTELPVQRILEEAGIARSTFYHYFPDKAQLLIKLAELATADIWQSAEQWWRSDHSDGETGLVPVLLTAITQVRENRLVLRAIREVAAYDRTVAEYWISRMTPYLELSRSRLEELRAAGKIGEWVDPARTAQIMAWTMERVVGLHHIPPEDDERWATALARSAWLIIYGDAP
ncbi:TetR/AcrR family transcriptional regulator [Pseudonocardiaceae bacterium YIM PH 21723]|nr:TetR/AcrR family transcriptional regulator [Pseudonocardiaceae bacterium YIM PH 21723]